MLGAPEPSVARDLPQQWAPQLVDKCSDGVGAPVERLERERQHATEEEPGNQRDEEIPLRRGLDLGGPGVGEHDGSAGLERLQALDLLPLGREVAVDGRVRLTAATERVELGGHVTERLLERVLI